MFSKASSSFVLERSDDVLPKKRQPKHAKARGGIISFWIPKIFVWRERERRRRRRRRKRRFFCVAFLSHIIFFALFFLLFFLLLHPAPPFFGLHLSDPISPQISSEKKKTLSTRFAQSASELAHETIQQKKRALFLDRREEEDTNVERFLGGKKKKKKAEEMSSSRSRSKSPKMHPRDVMRTMCLATYWSLVLLSFGTLTTRVDASKTKNKAMLKEKYGIDCGSHCTNAVVRLHEAKIEQEKCVVVVVRFPLCCFSKKDRRLMMMDLSRKKFLCDLFLLPRVASRRLWRLSRALSFVRSLFSRRHRTRTTLTYRAFVPFFSKHTGD